MRRAEISGLVLYRAVSLTYLRTAMSPKGARLRAGRFNRLDCAAHYLSGEPETAYAEFQQGNPEPTPCGIVAVRVTATDLIDLIDPGVALADPWTNWTAPWEKGLSDPAYTPPSWLCCDLALEEEVSGIVFPSQARSGGINYVLYPEDATAGCLRMEVIDPAGVIKATQTRKKK